MIQLMLKFVYHNSNMFLQKIVLYLILQCIILYKFLQKIVLYLYDLLHNIIMKPSFYVLLGDVISSRKIKNRDKFQKKLINTCDEINNAHKNDIYAKMKIIKGTDEIGCLLTDISSLYEIIEHTSKRLDPNILRFVLIKDEIDTGLDSKDISKMDGPAFHKASRIMFSLKKEKLIFHMETGNYIIDSLITNNINLIYLIKNRWSSKKIQIINEYETIKDQRKTAERLGIAQQIVSYHLKSSNWKEIKEIEKNLKEIIMTYAKEAGT
ncbi:MAG: hypothetical protein FJ150_09510 [Euryarchaeota archaeon]|nr:hypothetical protein [Euryarchaeota archaeon]